MANITYSIGGTSFNAVPESMEDSLDLAIRSESTIGHGVLHTVGTGKNKIMLKGRYMTKVVRDAIVALFESCSDSGTSVVFNDGYVDRNVLIRNFESVPIVGKTEGYSFRLELVVV